MIKWQKRKLSEIQALQKSFQFGTRVETKNGNKGIVNFFDTKRDICRVYYDVQLPKPEVRKEMAKISECRILSVQEAMLI